MAATALAALTLAGAGALAQDAGCVPTESDHLGPFYVSGMPVVEDINRFGKPGERMRVLGEVRSDDAGRAPVAGALVEIWQTDGEGDYHPHDNGRYSDYEDAELDMRGSVVSDEGGKFSFDTVVPAREGLFGRHKHIHYRVSADGHETLVTQHYIDEGSRTPGGRCRSARVEKAGGRLVYSAPAIYLRRI